MDKDFFKSNQIGFRFLAIDGLADKLGVPEAPLRFMLGMSIGFPMALIFLLLPSRVPTVKNLYCALCGMFICYFCFGSDSIYNVISILVSYVSLVLFGGTMANVIFAFLFQMGYLFGSYILFSSDGYDVMWTTPQCIICLRLIGLSWDCYDGKQKKEKLSADLQKSCYDGIPTFVEIFGYAFFYGSFMVGPQFSFRRYHDFINGLLVDEAGMKAKNSRFTYALQRFVAGLVFLVIFVKFDPLYPSHGLLEESFFEKSFFAKNCQMVLTYCFSFSKYFLIFYFTECVCVISGLTYNGTKDGYASWDGVRNVKFKQFIFGAFFQDVLEGFNINTSQWSGRYVFKRLRFLGSKTASHVLTLAFLSLWHGFYVGYAILFCLEFLLIIAERQLCSQLRIIFDTTYDELPWLPQLCVRIFGIVFKIFACAFAATAFMLLRWRRIKQVYYAVGYWLIIVIVVMQVIVMPLLSVRISQMKKKKSDKKTE